MRIHVALLPQHLPSAGLTAGDVAIVIDTLRFTTCASQALAVGATQIQIAAEVDEAKVLAEEAQHETLLCGERECKPIDGFDLGNSPAEYSRSRVGGTRLIFTTTNGTRAITAAQSASEIWLSALVNRHATCAKLARAKPESIWLVCAGTNGEVALEDVLAAGAIIDGAKELAALDSRKSNDSAWLAHALWDDCLRGDGIRSVGNSTSTTLTETRQRLAQKIAIGAGGQNVANAGYERDLSLAAELDSIDAVPQNSPDRWDVFTLSNG